MNLASFSRFFLFALPLFLFAAACDTVGEADALSDPSDATASPSVDALSIEMTPSPAVVGEEVTFSLTGVSDQDFDGTFLTWTTADDELLGTGPTVTHVFDTPGGYSITVEGLPETLERDIVVKEAPSDNS